MILNELHGRDRLIIERLYGSGLRVSECLRLRVQDIDIVKASRPLEAVKDIKIGKPSSAINAQKSLLHILKRLLKFNRMTTDKGLVHLCQMH
ncbi:tyrosine-type recombinase/integrase [Vibrio fluvialis]|uniref:tyrosine-type recombinase/integrase n=1 Tax=Vibrio fluvialis TaxID=676 RepID=UPI00398C535C